MEIILSDQLGDETLELDVKGSALNHRLVETPDPQALQALVLTSRLLEQGGEGSQSWRILQ